MTYIDGIGGAFVFSEDPASLARWYADAFDMTFEGSEEFGAFYTTYWGLDPDDPGRKMDTTFSIMKAKAPLPRAAPPADFEGMYGDQHFMINLRVRDLDAALTHMTSKGIEPLERSDYDYGLFAWVVDPDGNRVELYQPLPIEGHDT